MQCTKDHVDSSLRADPPLRHARERRAAKRSGRKESGKEAPKKIYQHHQRPDRITWNQVCPC